MRELYTQGWIRMQTREHPNSIWVSICAVKKSLVLEKILIWHFGTWLTLWCPIIKSGLIHLGMYCKWQVFMQLAIVSYMRTWKTNWYGMGFLWYGIFELVTIWGVQLWVYQILWVYHLKTYRLRFGTDYFWLFLSVWYVTYYVEKIR